MNRFKELSIKRKLILIIFLVALGSLVVTFTFVTIAAYNQTKGSLVNNARITTKLITEYAFSSIMFDDYDGLKEIVSKVETLPDVYSAAVYNEYGELIASFVRDSTKYQPSQYERLRIKDSNGFIHIKEDIMYNKSYLGRLHLTISTDRMNVNVIKNLGILIVIIIFMGIIIYLLAIRFQRLISKPIIKLSQTTRMISQDKDYSLRLKRETDDEIGELYDNFNEMIYQIQKQIVETNSAHEMTFKQYERFLTILNAFTEGVYISDPETNEILFANSSMQELFHSSLVGEKCHEVLMDFSEPCPFCDKETLTSNNEAITREQYNKVIGKYLSITDKLIRWPNDKIVRLQQIRDITKRKAAEEELRIYQENLEMLIEKRTAELRETNEKLEKSVNDVVEMNKLFVGREYRIKELRDELNILKEKAKD